MTGPGRQKTGAVRPHRSKPTFLVVGAAKAGTTSLYEYLRQHPAVFMPGLKEPSYFTNGYGIGSLDEYLDLFSNAGDREVIGEASTSYLSSPESPAWIRDVLGPVKIIILLRNPANRAYSLYAWMVREGYEWAPTFEHALRLEERRRIDPTFSSNPPQFFHDYMYFGSGLYAAQVRRYLETFERDNVLVLLFEEFIKEPVATCSRVYAFLGVDEKFTPAVERHNEGSLPVSIRLQYLLRHHDRYMKWIRPARYRRKLADALMLLNLRASRGQRPTVDRHSYEMLMSRYRTDIQELSTTIDRDLSIWPTVRP